MVAKHLSPPLTEFQIAVLRLVAQGLLNDAIAERLGVSPFTVRDTLRDIREVHYPTASKGRWIVRACCALVLIEDRQRRCPASIG